MISNLNLCRIKRDDTRLDSTFKSNYILLTRRTYYNNNLDVFKTYTALYSIVYIRIVHITL